MDQQPTEKVSFPISLISILVSAILLVVVIVVTYLLLKGAATKEMQKKQVSEVPANLIELNTADSTALHSYGWVDKELGKVQIPIEQAKKLLVQEAQAGR